MGQPKKSLEEIRDIVAQVTYKDGWSLYVGDHGDGHYYVQIQVAAGSDAAVDVISGVTAPWHGGKWFMSQYMTVNEIVRVCHKMIVAAEMHELDEKFRYKGRSIFNPHLDPDQLAEFAKWLKNFEFREDSMLMPEDEPQADEAV